MELAKKQHEEAAIKSPEPIDTSASTGPGGPEATPASTGARISTWMGKVASTARSKLGQVMEMEPTPDDAVISDIQGYAYNLDKNLKILARDAAALTQAYKVQVDKMDTMSVALSDLGTYTLEDNAVTVRTSSYGLCTKLGQNWQSLSKLASYQHASCETELDEPIQEMTRDVMALLKALAQRRDILFQYTRKAQAAKSKNVQMEKTRTSSSGNAKYGLYESELKILKEEGTKLWEQVNDISKRLQRDADRFRTQFAEKLRSTMEAFHSVQFQYSEKYVKGWQDILPHLAPLHVPTPSPSKPPPPSSVPPPPPSVTAIPSEEDDKTDGGDNADGAVTIKI